MTMQDRSPSLTALKVAALRALHQTMDTPVIFVDPLAARILGRAAGGLIESYRATADNTERLRGTLAARGIVAEDTIADATARGVRQCVILGAGLDTFAYRQDHKDLQIFEIDHPATQSWKRDLLRDAGFEVPASVRYVALDFARDDLFAALTAAGFDRMEPAVFTMLGVTPYLGGDLILEILGTIAAKCADAEIVFDYTEPYQDAPAPIRASYEAAAARVAAGGEPWITFFAPDALSRTLRSLGFSDIRDIDAAALHDRFCADRTDGLTVAALVHLIRARALGGGGTGHCDA